MCICLFSQNSPLDDLKCFLAGGGRGEKSVWNEVTCAVHLFVEAFKSKSLTFICALVIYSDRCSTAYGSHE